MVVQLYSDWSEDIAISRIEIVFLRKFTELSTHLNDVHFYLSIFQTLEG